MFKLFNNKCIKLPKTEVCPTVLQERKNNMKGEGEEIAKSFWIWRRKCKCLRTQAPDLLPTPCLPEFPSPPSSGTGVRPSSTHHLPDHHSATKRASSTTLSRGPQVTALTYFCAYYQDAASSKSPLGLPVPFFKTSICHQLSILDLTAALL